MFKNKNIKKGATMKTLIITKDKKKIVKKFNTIDEATEYLFLNIPNGKFNGLDVSKCEINKTIICLWYDYANSMILDNHTLKIKNPTKILEKI